MSLRVHRQIGPAWKILPEQTIGVLVGSALPGTLRVAEVNLDVGRQRKSPMIRKFLTPVPGQGLINSFGSVFDCLMSAETTVCVSLLATFASIT